MHEADRDNSETLDALPADVRQIVGDEHRRAVLYGLQTLDTSSDPDFDRLTGLAAALMDVPIALVSLVDIERQWFKSCIGMEGTETPVSLSFCAHAITAGDDVMVIPDATADPRFSSNSLVTGEPHIRFYAGAPITVSSERIGTLCVIDRKPRQRPSPEKLNQLKMLAGLASSLFALKEGTRTGALARAELEREEKRRTVAVEAASLASWAWDVRTGAIECDTLFPVLLGLAPTTRLTARQIFRAVDRRDVRQAERSFRQALSSNEDYVGEYRIAGIEPARWLGARGRVVERDTAGNATLVFGVNYDISERKLAEERQRLLLRELNHRVKNTLATVQALATQTVRHAREPGEFLDAFSARLQALGLAHGMLSDREWRGIALDELIQLEVKPFDDEETPRIKISGEDIFLSPDQALGLGLILHELASNAMKYGSLSTPGGTVSLGWKVEKTRQSRRLTLTWKEAGGPAVETPQRFGFGSILIRRSLSKIISSEVSHEFLPGGVKAKISMPLEQFAD
jgi:two-component sensor histidine kinase/PAS domain-containing protein